MNSVGGRALCVCRVDHRVLLRLLPVLTPRVPLPLLPVLNPRVLVWLLPVGHRDLRVRQLIVLMSTLCV